MRKPGSLNCIGLQEIPILFCSTRIKINFLMYPVQGADSSAKENKMIIDHPGNVTERILLLGEKASCVYLLKGEDEYAILGGGMTYIVPDVIRQLQEFNIEEKKIKQMVILHSHFDHCGIVPFFKRRWPWIKTTASARAKELLGRPKVIENISFLNEMLLAERGLQEKTETLELEVGEINVENIVGEGDIIPCGDLTMEVIDTPGHSSCSIAVYVPQEKAMFASDAGGIPFGDRVFTAANSNFDKYQDSLEKMAGYEIDVYLAEHFGARTGDDVRIYLKRSINSAKETRHILEASYRKTKDVQKSTQEITDRFMKWMPDGFMPRDIIAMVICQMLEYVAAQNP
jgi:glyoxylase-like metal-dependent hydrolase (beta-lactamase superfamily II)